MLTQAAKFIYGLCDPREPGHVRYVGMATYSQRPFDHAKEARASTRHTHRLHWIRKIQQEGVEPLVIVLQACPENSSRKFLGFVESCYIKSLREIGHQLTNGTDGGDGGATRTGQKHSAQTIAKLRYPKSAGHRAKISAARQGHEVSLFTRAKLSAAFTGRRHSVEACAKMSATHNGRALSVGHRLAIGEALKGRAFSVEARAHMSLAQKGRIHSEETRAKMSAAHKKHSADRSCVS